MKINPIAIRGLIANEIISEKVLINNEDDALDIMASVPSDHLILYEHNFGKDFFDLSTKKAGDILQKFTNYHIKLAIIGNFDKFTSKSLRDFIYESNKNRSYLFVGSMEEVIKIWQ